MKQISYELANGTKIPAVGFGTWQTPDGETAETAVREAIKIGYRHIDTAAAYNNEKSVGKGISLALAETGLKREDIFITSKVWNGQRGYETTKLAFEKTCSDLNVDYLDLYLIHWPASSHQFDNWKEINLDTWRAMVELYKAGKIKAIGVSNFLQHHLEPLMETEIIPMVDQIEFHPGYKQEETVDFCKKNNILVEAWSPIGSGRLLENQTLKEIAAKYNKSVANICIKWVLQNGVLPLPKSVTPSRIKENLNIFDFTISDEDMNIINNMPTCGESGSHPDKIDF